MNVPKFDHAEDFVGWCSTIGLTEPFVDALAAVANAECDCTLGVAYENIRTACKYAGLFHALREAYRIADSRLNSDLYEETA